MELMFLFNSLTWCQTYLFWFLGTGSGLFPWHGTKWFLPNSFTWFWRVSVKLFDTVPNASGLTACHGAKQFLSNLSNSFCVTPWHGAEKFLSNSLTQCQMVLVYVLEVKLKINGFCLTASRSTYIPNSSSLHGAKWFLFNCFNHVIEAVDSFHRTLFEHRTYILIMKPDILTTKVSVVQLMKTWGQNVLFLD